MRWIRSVLFSIQALQALIVGLGVIIGAASTVISVAFGSGSLALEEAISQEREAQGRVAEAQGECAATMVEFICKKQQDLCRLYPLRNSMETATGEAFTTGTALKIHELTRNVIALEDLPEERLPDLDTKLRIAIELAIRGALGKEPAAESEGVENWGIESATVKEGVENCGCFGGAHQYAGLVWNLVTSQVWRKSLEGTPELVEKPEWWRDWLLGSGVAVGGLMVGGVVGALVWKRISQEQTTSY